MQVSYDATTIVILNSVPATPAARAAASPVASVTDAEKRSRYEQRHNPSGSPSRFRSVLDAATVAAFGQFPKKSDASFSSDGITEPKTEFKRAENPSRDISGQDSEILYRAMRAYASQTNNTDTSDEAVTEEAYAPVPSFVA